MHDHLLSCTDSSIKSGSIKLEVVIQSMYQLVICLYQRTCLSRALNNAESCLTQTPIYTEHERWSQGALE